MTETRDRLRVVHVLWRLSKGGGVQTVVRQIADSVDASEIELHVVSVRPRIAEDDLDAVPMAFHSVTTRRYGIGRVESALFGCRVAAVLRRLRPDVVHLHSGTAKLGVPASLLMRRPAFVLEVHDAPGSGRHGRWTDLAEGLWARARGATVVSHSRSVESEIEQRWRLRPSRRRRFPLAVHVEAFSTPRPSADVRSELGVGREEFVLVTVGRLVSSKRFDLGIASVAALRANGVPARLVVVGDGPESEKLRSGADELGLGEAIVFAGPRFDADLADVLWAADVLVSTASYEGFGLTIVEAMACERPTVVMEVGGVGDIVVDGVTGRLVPYDDLPAMVSALSELYANPEMCRAMGSAGRARVEREFSLAALGRNFSELYRTVVADDDRWALKRLRPSAGR